MNKRQEKTVLKAAMSIIGRRTSERKKKAARQNAAKGRQVYKLKRQQKPAIAQTDSTSVTNGRI